MLLLNGGDYLAESWSAYHVESESLSKYDPVGLKMVDDAMSLLKWRKL
jgi:hypothetical protein